MIKRDFRKNLSKKKKKKTNGKRFKDFLILMKEVQIALGDYITRVEEMGEIPLKKGDLISSLGRARLESLRLWSLLKLFQ